VTGQAKQRLRVALLDDYQGVALGCADWSSLEPCDIATFARPLAGDALVEAVAGFDVLCLMRERTELDAAVLSRLPRLRLVVVTGNRFRNVDRDAAAAQGITVVGTGNLRALGAPAEQAMALLLAAARRIPVEDRAMREGRWQTGLGRSLEGLTLGILGLGRFGTMMAGLGRAFGMEVIAWSPSLTPEQAAAAGARRVARDALFAESDALSIHLVLSERSRGIVGAAELALMKPDAILVNTSRGALIDEAALVAALRAGRPGMAALDVFEAEPLPPGHPLLALPNTVLAPHMGFVTEQAYRQYYADAVAAVAGWRKDTGP
jgi:phosphoglycerate dehydrogenase-like enzyme